MNSLSELAHVIKSLENVYILTHIYPDGDAMASAFVLCRVLQKLGKKATVIMGEDIPKKFEFFNSYITFQEFKPDYVVSVDLASDSLLSSSLENYAGKIDICIDHHISNRGFAPINYIDPSAAACSEIIYDCILKLNLDIDKKMAEGLYVGISTDTGCFKYSNTTYKSHLIVSELMRKGINTSTINEKLFTVKSQKQLNLEKVVYENLEYFLDGKCALTSVLIKDMEKLGIRDEECEGIASIPLRIEGIGIGLTLREKLPNSYKVSVRTSANYDANKIASLFGGGGHIKASGFNISGPLEDVKNTIIKTIKLELGC